MAAGKKTWRIRKRDIVIAVFAFIATVAGIRASDGLLNKNKEAQGVCPTGMAYVLSSGGGFCIDVYENSLGKACPFSNPKNQAESRTDIEQESCYPVSEKGSTPWVNISQSQAALACRKAGKRLPTNEEWQAAALGTPDLLSDWSASDCQVDFNWDKQPGLTGSAKSCVSASGAFDMIGNVWEWVDETISEGKLGDRELPEQGYVLAADQDGIASETASDTGDENYYHDYLWIKKQGVRAVARGGYWDNQSKAGQYSAYMVSQPSFTGIGVGFRCVK